VDVDTTNTAVTAAELGQACVFSVRPKGLLSSAYAKHS
jgi:hypothetical protein